MGETHVNEEELMQEEVSASKERVNTMKKKTDLSDIILEKEQSSQSKAKKMILGLASLVLLFLVFLIFSKLINSDTNDNNTTESKDSNKIILTDEKTDVKKSDAVEKKQTNKTTDTNKDEKKNLSDTDLKFEEMVKKLREEDSKDGDNKDVVKVVTPPKESKPKDEKKVTEVKEKVLTAVKEKKSKLKSIVITDANKPVISKTTKVKPVKTKKPSYVPSFGSSKSGYYIQVGATTTPYPNKYLSAKIRNNGYRYITHPIVVKGRKFYKILIGPYSSRSEAGANMDNVKATINPKAFFYHIR